MKSETVYHRYLLDSFRKRPVADYQHNAEVGEAEAIEIVSHAEDFLGAAKDYLTLLAAPTP